MNEIKAELVWIGRHPADSPHNYRKGRCEETDCRPHYIIPAAGVPSEEVLAKMTVEWARKVYGVELADKLAPIGLRNAGLSFARHVLDAMGLREVE